MNEIPTQAEMQHLVERNKTHDLCRPEYTAWTDNRGVCATVSQLLEANRRAGLADLRPLDCAGHVRWQKRLHSKHWRVMRHGSNTAWLVERTIKTQQGWRHVPLNGRV